MQEPPDGMILTIGKNAAAVINRIAVNITTCHKTTYHPFLPAYPSAICKVQGQNLGKILLWLDCSIAS